MTLVAANSDDAVETLDCFTRFNSLKSVTVYAHIEIELLLLVVKLCSCLVVTGYSYNLGI